MNWFSMKMAGVRRWAVDALMAGFLLAALVGALVLAYFAVN